MMQLKFERKEDAIRFCETQGFKYEVEELPPQFPPVFKQYADKIQPPAVLSKMRAVVIIIHSSFIAWTQESSFHLGLWRAFYLPLDQPLS